MFLPGESPWTEESGGLYRPWDRKELDMAERLSATIFEKENVLNEHNK